MITRFLDSLKCCRALIRGAGFLLAVSGGPDSIGMLQLFLAAKEEFDFRIEAIHLNHCIRGKEGERDANFTRKVCAEAGVPFQLLRFEVRKFALREKISLEAAGRRIRRHLFLRCAHLRKLDFVAFAHTSDDQAETVLMNLLRGAGPRGLSGIPARSGPIIHPILPFKKDELLRYLDAKGIPYMLDSTNQDLRHFRNQIRHKILPCMEKTTKLPVKENLLRLARICREEEGLLEEQLQPLFAERFSPLGFGVFEIRISSEEFSPAIERRLLRLFFEAATGGIEGVSFSLIEEMRKLLLKGTGKRFEFLHFVMEKTQTGLALSCRAEKWKEEIPFLIPGETRLKQLGVVVRAELFPRSDIIPIENPREWLSEAKDFPAPNFPKMNDSLDYELLKPPFSFRARREGDFFFPIGMEGGKKLQDYFVDRKIPKILRDKIPILATPDGIAWVGGCCVDRRVAVTPRTKRMVKLNLRHE